MTALPHNGWLPRDHQDKLWNYLQAGGKRAMAIWHRRAGKDEVCLHHLATSAMRRKANYFYALPEYNQGRKSIWNAVNPHTGNRRIDEAFPAGIRESTNDSTMFIRFVNGSTFQVIGSDQYNTSMVGSSAAGIVFSEWALCNPSAWAYARPMIEENNGWAIFITTPRGRNHAHEMYKYAGQSRDWFCELLTAEETRAMSHEALDEARQEMVALYGGDAGHGMWRQEYFCDFNSALLGAFYAREMSDVRSEGRVDEIEPILDRPVNCAWDLGMADDTVVIWWQAVGGQLFILDALVASGVSVEWYRDEIFKREQERGWIHGADYVPHDANVKEWGTGRTRIETMRTLGLNPTSVPHLSMNDGINAVRRTLPLCVFHPRCEDTLISALEQYRREWDDDKKAFRASPLHDWSSHPSDAFRYMSLAWRPAPLRIVKVPKREGFYIPPPDEDRGRFKGIRL